MGARASTTGTPGGGVKRKVAGGMGALGCSPVKVKRVTAPSVSWISIAVMVPSAVTVRVRRWTRFSWPWGTPARVKLPLAAGDHGEVVDFFFELGVAEEEAERRTEIVELLGCDALDLRVAFGVEPGVFAVEEKELAGWIGVVPAHAAGLEEEEGSAFGADAAEAFVGFGELGFEGMEVVVVVVDALGEVVGGGLLGAAQIREDEEDGEQGRSAVPSALRRSSSPDALGARDAVLRWATGSLRSG